MLTQGKNSMRNRIALPLSFFLSLSPTLITFSENHYGYFFHIHFLVRVFLFKIMWKESVFGLENCCLQHFLPTFSTFQANFSRFFCVERIEELLQRLGPVIDLNFSCKNCLRIPESIVRPNGKQAVIQWTFLIKKKILYANHSITRINDILLFITFIAREWEVSHPNIPTVGINA